MFKFYEKLAACYGLNFQNGKTLIIIAFKNQQSLFEKFEN